MTAATTENNNQSNAVLAVSGLLFMLTASAALFFVQQNHSLPLLAFGLYSALNVIAPPLYWIEKNTSNENLADVAALLHRVRGVGFYILAFELLLNGGASFFVAAPASFDLIGLWVGLSALPLYYFLMRIQKQTGFHFLSETAKTGAIFAGLLGVSTLLNWATATQYPEALAGLALAYVAFKEGQGGTAQGRCFCEVKP